MDFYGTVEGFFEYCASNGYDVDELSPSPEDTVEVILRRGSVYIDGAYLDRFPGTKTGGRSQIRAWPRTGASDVEGHEIPVSEVPVEIEQATYEAALREYDQPGSLVPDYVGSDRVKSESVGPLSVTYADSHTEGSARDAYPVIGVIDRILSPLLGSSSGTGSTLFGEVTR